MAAKKNNIALFLCVPIKACSGRPFLRPKAPENSLKAGEAPDAGHMPSVLGIFFAL